MRNFWQHLVAAWRYGTTFPYFEQSDEKEFWTDEDALATARFFNSFTGRKLSMRLTNYVTKMALAAVQNPQCSPYMNGQASGVSACIAAISAHCPQEQAEEQEQTEAQIFAEKVGI